MIVKVQHFKDGIIGTYEEGNHPSLVDAIWLMNDEGKTIEKLI